MLEWMFTAKQLIDYIDSNAIRNPSLTDIAEKVGYSPYHCSEQFHKVAGMTIREYISKRKLYTAAMALQKTQDAIIDKLYTQILCIRRADGPLLYDILDPLGQALEKDAREVAKLLAGFIRENIPDYLLGQWSSDLQNCRCSARVSSRSVYKK